MTQDSATQMNEIKRYLYGEMSGEERDRMEEEFFENDELFFEIADTENNLVDLYARGKLTGEELTRFERSLEKFPERRVKVANAVALRTFIAEERPPEETKTVVAGQSVWQKIADFFTIKTPTFGYSMAALLLIFAITTVFLLIDNHRKSGEIAGLKNSPQANWEQKQKELEEKLDAVNARFEDLQKESESQGKAGDEAQGELDRVSEEKERIRKELEQLQKERSIVPTPTPKQPTAPTFASFLLTPTVGTRGGSGTASRNLSIERETKTVSMRLVLPGDFNKDDRVSITLNGKTLASNLPAQKSLQIKISPDDIADGLNRIAVVNTQGKEISKYVFNMKKK